MPPPGFPPLPSFAPPPSPPPSLTSSLTEQDFPSPLSKEDFQRGQILAVLPEGNDYELESCAMIETGDESELQFVVEGRANISTKEGVYAFIEEFSNSSGGSYNMQSGRQDRSGKNADLFGHRKCIMNVHHDKKRGFLRPGLHRNCPSDFQFRLDKAPVSYKRDTDERRSKKELISNYPLHFTINFKHNHQLNRHEHSRFTKVSQETKTRFLFKTQCQIL